MIVQRVTYVGVAKILGCHISSVPKLIAKGQLNSQRSHPGGLLDLRRIEQSKLVDRRLRVTYQEPAAATNGYLQGAGPEQVGTWQ